MKLANLADVKNELSKYVAQVRKGARVRILVRGVPAADLVPVESAASTDESDEFELAELERLGWVRRGAPATPRDERELDRPGPRIKGRRAVETLLAERRSSR